LRRGVDADEGKNPDDGQAAHHTPPSHATLPFFPRSAIEQDTVVIATPRALSAQGVTVYGATNVRLNAESLCRPRNAATNVARLAKNEEDATR
jgi:hypothetical protein